MQIKVPLTAAAGLATLAFVATGCGDSGGGSTPVRTVTATSTVSGTPTGSPTGPTGSPSETESAGPLRKYPGAEVVTDSKNFVMLSTDDSVEMVGDFYVDQLKNEGWDVVSKYQGKTSVHLLARKGGQGLTIQVSPTGTGTSVSITWYGV